MATKMQSDARARSLARKWKGYKRRSFTAIRGIMFVCPYYYVHYFNNFNNSIDGIQ